MPKSSIATLTPCRLSRSRIVQAIRVSRKSALSVISSSRRAGSRPLSASACASWSISPRWKSWAGDRLTDMRIFGHGGGARAGLAQHPGAERHHQAGILGDRQKLARQDQALLRMAPAQQGLEADHRLGPGLDLRLVMELELAVWRRRARGRSRAPCAATARRPSPARRSGSCRGPRPWRRAARDRRASGDRRHGGHRRGSARTPMPAVRIRALSSISSGRARVSVRRRQSASAAAGWAACCCTIANSSPPMRATSPPSSMQARRRSAQAVITPSPALWPRVSLTSLKRSRSRQSNAAWSPLWRGPRQGVLEPLQQPGAVGEVGQGVVRRQMPGLGLGEHGLRDVRAGAAEPAQPARGVVHRAPVELEMTLAALRQREAKAELAEGAPAGQIGAMAHPGLVVGEHAARPPGRPGPRELHQGRRRVIRDRHQALLGVDLPQPFGGRRGELDEAPFRRPPPLHFVGDRAPAAHRGDAAGDRQEHQQRPQVAEQPAPVLRRPCGEQPGDIDQRAEREGPAGEHQHGDDVAQAHRAGQRPDGARVGIAPVAEIRHGQAVPSGVGCAHSRAATLRNPLCGRSRAAGSPVLDLPSARGYS